ncbi:MAG: hypothetical protein ABJ205_08800 [Erythrobacter sp.]|uniref:hypothetical protein n=1 Tax=Erythrobacter sp. TaxID=1042 RepID=UPI003263D059
MNKVKRFLLRFVSILPWKQSAVELDQVFQTIGEYVLLFQQLESQIDQALLIWWGTENWTQSQRRLEKLSFAAKLSRLKDEFKANPGNQRGRERPEWPGRFEALLNRLDAEREHRNSLVHSAYLFEAFEHGGPIIQSDRVRRQGEVQFDQTQWTQEYQAQQLKRVRALLTDLGQCRVQIIHDLAAMEQQ